MIEVSAGGPKIKKKEDLFSLIVQLRKWKYTLPDNLKRQEQVSLDSAANEKEYALPDNREWREQVSFCSAANEIELRTAWE